MLTADKLIKRNWQCNPTCPLCDQAPETAQHLCLNCVYAQEVWVLVAQWTEGLVAVPDREAKMEHWWNGSLTGIPKSIKRENASILIYTAWNIWKERNRSLRGMLCAAATSPRANQGRNENKEHCLRRGCATTCFSMIVLLLEFEIISYLVISNYVITNLLLLLI